MSGLSAPQDQPSRRPGLASVLTILAVVVLAVFFLAIGVGLLFELF